MTDIKRPTPADVAWRVKLFVYDMNERRDRMVSYTVVAGSSEGAVSKAKESARAAALHPHMAVDVRSMALKLRRI